MSHWRPSEDDDVPAERVHQMLPDPSTPGAWLVRVAGTDQSWLDPDDPGRLEFDYMRRIGDHLDLCAPAGQRLRVVHVGGAGMSLARYLAHTRPTSAQIVLEPDEEVTALVRKIAPLARTSGVKVRPVDGLTGIADLADDYADVIILDAFKAGSVPGDLVTEQFFADIARVLASRGLLLINLVDERPFEWSRRAVAGLVARFADVVLSAEASTLKGRRAGNLVVAASGAPLPVAELDRLAAGAAFPYRVIADTELITWLSGARPFTTADTADSPEIAQMMTWFR